MLCVKAKTPPNPSPPLDLVLQERLVLAKKPMIWVRDIKHLEMFGVFGDGLVQASCASHSTEAGVAGVAF